MIRTSAKLLTMTMIWLSLKEGRPHRRSIRSEVLRHRIGSCQVKKWSKTQHWRKTCAAPFKLQQLDQRTNSIKTYRWLVRWSQNAQFQSLPRRLQKNCRDLTIGEHKYLRSAKKLSSCRQERTRSREVKRKQIIVGCTQDLQMVRRAVYLLVTVPACLIICLTQASLSQTHSRRRYTLVDLVDQAKLVVACSITTL